ncbi:peptidase C14, caspase catalytic [Aspergillus terreus]|uniref:Peptidase C14, caspase catalytic n=1 Tax=Aspergillus terreus TaxID=33178 RepID=A0A5M3ZF41_ASPTE|nr:hypothetical protein ATETN484_0013029400 [Aspergillus terreus]GFF20528.1 peptidase C14, caspase catalytic [Aspergillus terreus]
MCDTKPPISRYAILIGINAYQERPLKGSVQDVQRIERYLKEASTSVQIEMLTATRSDDDGGARRLMEPQHSWPTHRNVVSALTRVLSSAKAGDLVYIHYSGHGTRIGSQYLHSNWSTGDLALVLLDERNEGREKYLYGAVLASHLRKMVDNGLVLTLVLDCCFSAAVYRHDDSTVRYLPYNPDLSEDSAEETSSSGYGHRDACMLPNWLINPDGYAILAACGPHEVAKEIDPGNGQMHGALSYFLLAFIEINGLGIRHDAIHKHLASQFQESNLHQQSPVVYGNRKQPFFQQSDFENPGAITSIIMNPDASLVLSAGNAHGIHIGDCFALQGMNSAEEDCSLSSGHSLSIRVVQVGPLTSKVDLLGGPAPSPTSTRWFATGYPRKYFQKYPVRLAGDLPHLHKLLRALEAQSLSCHMNEKQEYSFYITMNNNSQYEIHDRSGNIIENLPDMVQGRIDFGTISNIVEHLVRYKFTRDLSNNIFAEQFQQLFDAHIISPSGVRYEPGHLIETDEGVVHLLGKLETGRLNKKATVRSSKYSRSGTPENWAALNFPIRTFVEHHERQRGGG